MPRPLRIAVALGMLAALALAACGGDGDRDDGVQVVTSDDGLVTIEIPQGALPEGMAIGDIEIAALDVDDFGVEGEGADGSRVVAAIELLPSGTVFDEPVTIRTRMPVTAEPGLALLVSEDGGVEALELSFEADGEDVITSVEVSHFSELVHMGGIDAIDFEFDPPIQDHLVGETFTVRARVSRIDFEEERKQVILFGEPFSLYRFRPSDDRAWAIDVTVDVFGPAVTAQKVRSDEAADPELSALFIEAKVTCERPGPYRASIGGYAKVGVRVIPVDPPGETRDLRGDSSYGDFVSQSASCLASDEVRTPTPEPFPTLSPTPSAVAETSNAFEALMEAVLAEMPQDGSALLGQVWTEGIRRGVDRIVPGITTSSFPENVVPPQAPTRPETGFESSGASHWDLGDQGRQRLFANTVFPCGQGEFAFTLCPEPLGSSPGGEHLVLVTELAGPLPVPTAEPDAQYQYGFVFDADGSTAGNYQANPSFPNDFFDGTDRWYTANYSPGSGWTMAVTQVTAGAPTAVASAARIIILDNVMMLVVPASEFSVAQPAYRVTAFWHTGDFGRNPPNVWSGDVFPAVADGLSTTYIEPPLVIAE